MTDYYKLSTAELIRVVREDASASERELVLLSRLCDALDEIDALTAAVEQQETA